MCRVGSFLCRLVDTEDKENSIVHKLVVDIVHSRTTTGLHSLCSCDSSTVSSENRARRYSGVPYWSRRN